MNKTFARSSNSACVSGAHSQRITREEVATLRNITVQKKTLTHKLKQAFHVAWRDLSVLVNAPINAVRLNNSMCKYYGHVIQGPWQGYLPKCRDCGSEISSPDQLRKASPVK
jgi:hypothetical protein